MSEVRKRRSTTNHTTTLPKDTIMRPFLLLTTAALLASAAGYSMLIAQDQPGAPSLPSSDAAPRVDELPPPDAVPSSDAAPVTGAPAVPEQIFLGPPHPDARPMPVVSGPADQIPGLPGGTGPSSLPPVQPPVINSNPLTSPPAGGVPGDVVPIQETMQPTVQVLRLQNADVSEVAMIVTRIFAERDLTVSTDTSTNSLILRASPQDSQQIVELIEQLDVAAADHRNRASKREQSDAELRLEQRIRTIDSQLRETQTAPFDQGAGNSNERVAALLKELHSAIDESFSERQRQQLAEIDELTARLQKLAQAVREREARREEIINERLRQLTNRSQERPSVTGGDAAPRNSINVELNPFARPVMPRSEGTTSAPEISEHAARLQQMLTRLYPEEAIEVVEITNESVRLSGVATSPQVTTEIESIVEQFYPTVLNHMTVPRANDPVLVSDSQATGSPAAGTPMQPIFGSRDAVDSVPRPTVNVPDAAAVSVTANSQFALPSIDNLNQLRSRIQDHSSALGELQTKISLQNTTQHPDEVQQTLATLRSQLDEDTRDCGTYRELIELQLQTVKAQCEVAAQSMERIDKLTQAGAISAEEIDKARLLLESQKVRVQQTEVLLKLINDIEQSANTALNPTEVKPDEKDPVRP